MSAFPRWPLRTALPLGAHRGPDALNVWEHILFQECLEARWRPERVRDDAWHGRHRDRGSESATWEELGSKEEEGEGWGGVGREDDDEADGQSRQRQWPVDAEGRSLLWPKRQKPNLPVCPPPRGLSTGHVAPPPAGETLPLSLFERFRENASKSLRSE